MTCPLSERAPSASNLIAKNRVWGFFENSNRTRPANRRKPSELRRKIRLTPTKTASGIPYWPSRDPLEESGGINLYNISCNNAVNKYDMLGLFFTDGRRYDAKDGRGSIVLDARGGYAIRAAEVGSNPLLKSAAENHEQRHIDDLKLDTKKRAHAIPYKQVFCLEKNGVKKFKYFRYENGKLGIADFHPKNETLLWSDNTWLTYTSHAEHLEFEKLATNVETTELKGYLTNGELDKDTRDKINNRIIQMNNYITGIEANKEEDYTDWPNFIAAYIKAKNDAVKLKYKFGWHDEVKVYNEIK